MPLSGVIARPEAAVADLLFWSTTRSPIGCLIASDILPDDDLAEVLAVETDLGGTTLTFVNAYIPYPRNYAPDFNALLEDHGDKMVLGDFNAHHPSWISRTGDDRAAANREAFNGAVSSSQLAVAYQDLPTRLPSQGQPSSQHITLLNGHLLPDVTWSTLTILGSDHLPLQSRPTLTAESMFLYELPQRWLGGIHCRDREDICRYASTNLLLCWGKVFRWILSNAGRHHIPCGYVRDYAALSPKLCDPSSRRETSTALMTLSTLPSSCWTGTSSGKDQWTSLLEYSNRATNPKSARGRVPHQTYQSPLKVKPNPIWSCWACSSQQDQAITRLMRDLHRHHRVDPS